MNTQQTNNLCFFSTFAKTSTNKQSTCFETESHIPTTLNNDYKRVDMHHPQSWRPIFNYRLNEQCLSLPWIKLTENIFGACTIQYTNRIIKIYDLRGMFE
jgi:hypothetical protein